MLVKSGKGMPNRSTSRRMSTGRSESAKSGSQDVRFVTGAGFVPWAFFEAGTVAAEWPFKARLTTGVLALFTMRISSSILPELVESVENRTFNTSGILCEAKLGVTIWADSV